MKQSSVLALLLGAALAIQMHGGSDDDGVFPCDESDTAVMGECYSTLCWSVNGMEQHCMHLTESDAIRDINSGIVGGSLHGIDHEQATTDDLMEEVCRVRGICGDELRSEFQSFGKDYSVVELARISAHYDSAECGNSNCEHMKVLTYWYIDQAYFAMYMSYLLVPEAWTHERATFMPGYCEIFDHDDHCDGHDSGECQIEYCWIEEEHEEGTEAYMVEQCERIDEEGMHEDLSTGRIGQNFHSDGQVFHDDEQSIADLEALYNEAMAAAGEGENRVIQLRAEFDATIRDELIEQIDIQIHIGDDCEDHLSELADVYLEAGMWKSVLEMKLVELENHDDQDDDDQDDDDDQEDDDDFDPADDDEEQID